MSDSKLSRRRFATGVATAAGALAFAPGVVEAAEKWETVAREDGVIISVKPEPGRQYPLYRGIGRVNANKWQILAVFADADRHKDWMYRCMSSRLLDRPDPHTFVVYNRSKAPWPVKDRDVVFQAKVSVTHGGKEIWIKTRNVAHPKAPALFFPR